MQLEGILFLASQTRRSQSYAQAMAAHQLEPENVLVFGEPPANAVDTSRIHIPNSLDSQIFFPDLEIPLLETLERARWKTVGLETSEVNDPAIQRQIHALHPRLVIYSGYGGQIVRQGLLEMGIPFLHIHSGWLPDERGSTTIYYSLLRNHACSASAIILEPDIDTGPIVARKRFPKPPPGMDVDYLYDNAIRANLLLEVLLTFQKEGRMPEAISQSRQAGRTFYVIHPVLKHVALLSLEE